MKYFIGFIIGLLFTGTLIFLHFSEVKKYCQQDGCLNLIAWAYTNGYIDDDRVLHDLENECMK